jgi:hypothetical protein
VDSHPAVFVLLASVDADLVLDDGVEGDDDGTELVTFDDPRPARLGIGVGVDRDLLLLLGRTGGARGELVARGGLIEHFVHLAIDRGGASGLRRGLGGSYRG